MSDQPPPDETETPEDPETRKYLIEYLKGAPEVQLRDSVDLDAKVIGLFAAASVVIGLTTLGSIGRGTGGLNSWVTGFLIAAVVAYAGSAAATLRVLWPAEHWRSLHADELWSAGKAKPIAEIQTFLLNSIEQAYGSNKRLLKRKANAAFWVGIAVAAEIVCIGVALILTRF